MNNENYKREKFVTVDLSKNRVIGKDVVGLLLRYGRDVVREIGFGGGLFGFDEVVEELFEFVQLDCVNDGVCSIMLNRDNFARRSQKYLKLFMRFR
jgi:hypothetical protein